MLQEQTAAAELSAAASACSPQPSLPATEGRVDEAAATEDSVPPAALTAASGDDQDEAEGSGGDDGEAEVRCMGPLGGTLLLFLHQATGRWVWHADRYRRNGRRVWTDRQGQRWTGG
jgi:hypothetical protein